MILITLIPLVAFLVVYFWKNIKYKKMYETFKVDYTNYPIIGHSYLFYGSDEDRMNSIQNVGRKAIEAGGIVTLWFANKLYTVVADPAIADVILKNCSEKDYTMKYMQQLLGNGTISAPVPIWRIRRKILSASFSVKNLNGFVDIFSNQAQVMTDQLKSVGLKATSIMKFLAPCAMDVVYECVFGMKIGAQKNQENPIVKAWDEFRDVVTARMCRPWLHPDFVYRLLPYHTKLENHKAFLEGVTDKEIQRKMVEMKNNGYVGDKSDNNRPNRKTFVEDLITISQRIGGYSKQELQEETLVLVMAASDSSTVGTSFTCLMLAKYPEVQDKVYEEVQQVFGNSTRAATPEDLLQLKYLEAVIKETLRLYPPIPVIVREVLHDVTLPSGATVVKNTGSLIDIWAIHRNPCYWGSDAEEFKAERFLDLTLKHPAQFMPFSYGPRSCLGPQFAMTLMKTVVSTLLRSYKIQPLKNSESDIRVRYDLTMKAVDGFLIHLEPRNNKL